MFGFLKDKLKNALGKFSKDVEKEAVVEKKEVIVEKSAEPEKEIPVIEPAEKPKKKNIFQKIFGKKEIEDEVAAPEKAIEKLEGTPAEKIKEAKTEPTKPKKTEKPASVKASVKTEPKPEKKPEKKIEIKKEIERKQERQEKVEKIIEEKKQAIEAAHIKDSSGVLEAIEEQQLVKASEQKMKELPKEPETPVAISTPAPVVEEKKGFFTRITETFTKFNLSEERFEELFWELEVVMLENNVAVEVIDKIKADLKKELMHGKISRKGVEETILSSLKHSIEELFDVDKRNIIAEIKSKRQKEKLPYVIAVIGVNGSGKTTSIAKLTHLLQKNGLKVVLAASDTFRAAAIQQLEEHATRLNTKLIKHDYNSDPAAVGFDAVKYATAKDMDVVIIDTAGRLHSNTNLMEELKKVIRVCKPDIKIFVGESITGNDCVEQAKEFDKAVGIDAIILAKADIDEKGGAAISVSYILKRPILYIGTGQTYDDLKEFDSKIIIESLEL